MPLYCLSVTTLYCLSVARLYCLPVTTLYCLFVARFGVDMSQFPTISRVGAHLDSLEPFQAAHPGRQPDCPEELR